jgi:hypothetical protein
MKLVPVNSYIGPCLEPIANQIRFRENESRGKSLKDKNGRAWAFKEIYSTVTVCYTVDRNTNIGSTKDDSPPIKNILKGIM